MVAGVAWDWWLNWRKRSGPDTTRDPLPALVGAPRPTQTVYSVSDGPGDAAGGEFDVKLTPMVTTDL
jgi:hypothetical protein